LPDYPKGRRFYVLLPNDSPKEMSIWSNLTKLYEFLRNEMQVDLQSYSSIYKKVQADNFYKLEIENKGYEILVKHLE